MRTSSIGKTVAAVVIGAGVPIVSVEIYNAIARRHALRQAKEISSLLGSWATEEDFKEAAKVYRESLVETIAPTASKREMRWYKKVYDAAFGDIEDRELYDSTFGGI